MSKRIKAQSNRINQSILNNQQNQSKTQSKRSAAPGLMALLTIMNLVSLQHRAYGRLSPPAYSTAIIFQIAPRATTQINLPELKRFLQQATTAINSHDSAEIQPFVMPAALSAFDWVRSKSTRSWAGDVLTLAAMDPSGKTIPDAHPSYIAVFHAWHTCESDGDHLHTLEKTPDGWRLGAEIPETETGGYRIRDHALTITMDIAKQAVAIQDRVRIEVTPEGRAATCLVRLSEDFRLSALTIDTLSVPFQQVGGIIAFVPPTIKPDAKTFTLGLTYAGRVSHQGSDYILPQEATLDSYWYPHIARLPATATITVTAPSEWTAIAQGERKQEHRNPDSTTTVTYRNELPTSFFTVDVGRYVLTQRTVNGRVLSIYLRSANAERAQQSLDLLQQSLAYFDANFASFPYTHYEIVETKGPFGGALEAYSFATFGAGTLPSTVVHELSHTWWGGLVPCTYTRSMWNEGFAEYSSALFDRVRSEAKNAVKNEPENEAQNGAEPQEEKAFVDDDAAPRKRPKFGKAFDTYTLAEAHDTSDGPQEAVGYGKGGLVMRVLEEELGRAMLLRCLQTFVKDHQKGEAAEWPEFAQAVNKTTGQDYGWFFEQWTRRKGLPRVRLANVTTRRLANGYEVQGEIVQEGEPYRLRLPLRLRNQEGKAKQWTVDVQGERTVFRLQTQSLPTRLILDPDNLLPLETTTEQATMSLGM